MTIMSLLQIAECRCSTDLYAMYR